MDATLRTVLCINGWYGYAVLPVEVVGETAKRYRIRSDKPINLPGRQLMPGQTALVPKYAIKTLPQKQQQEGNHALRDS